MAKEQNAKNSVATILRGMREVARVTFTKKPLETDFTPQKPDNTKKPEDTPSDDKVPLRKISGNNELIIAPEYVKEMTDFFTNHAVLDSYTAPCYFNNDSCDVNMCVFPRIMRPISEQPFVKDIIAITVRYGNTILAMAEYNTMDEKAVDAFKKDLDTLTPTSYRAEPENEYQSLRDALMSKFPGLVVPENAEPEPDLQTKES